MDAIGEVLTSSIVGFTGEFWNADDGGMVRANLQMPRFGSFVRAESSDTGLNVFGVVYNVVTGPQDSMHKPTALRMSRDELRLQQPHIFSLLRTEVYATIVGYELEGQYHKRLPPHPPLVHDFLFKCLPEEVVAITEDFDFVRFLTEVPVVPIDELIASAVQEAYQARNRDYKFLVTAGQTISRLIPGDYDRLVSVLRKIRPTD
ncbi:MAG: hypothetical protein U0105_05045 [Candidatus Obscuribacterales bacterium]